jgi:calcium-independent phospholipase A2
VSAVKKDHINLKLHFFNNCFNDDHHKHCKKALYSRSFLLHVMPLMFTGPVWKVARYTCAAPVLFGESDDYVDGGLLANNPSDSALSKIQSFHRSRNEKFPVSLVVSVGCGKYPFLRLGNVDFLFVGSQWSSLSGTSNLMSLLSYAVSMIATRT